MSDAATERPLVLITEELSPAAEAWLGERAEVRTVRPDDRAFNDLLARASALVIRTYTSVDAALLTSAPRLKVIGRAGVGTDNIDLAACRERGVRIVNSPDANTRAVVEFVLATLLDVFRPRLFLIKALDSAAWRALRRDLIAPRELAGLTMGILGLGRIGSQVARAAAALDVRILYHDIRDIPASSRHGATPVALHDLLAESDILTIHVDGRPSNRAIINAETFARMKPDVVLVNTSRGFVIDNFALADFLIAHADARALIDVHEPEPFGPDYPLLDIDNVHLTPHIASATAQAKENMSWVVRDVWKVLQGEEPECEVRE